MVNSIRREELERALKEGEVLALEALPPEYFEAGHLPGARNLPLDKLEDLAHDLIPSLDQPVVTYCSNTACNNSAAAAERLVRLGYRNVRKFPGGKEEWSEAGLPLESGGEQEAGARTRR